jgi:MFS transporter, DHA2 family, methylenomycin A resistance protein
MNSNAAENRREHLLFLSVMIVTFMIGFDTTGLGVAIPDIATKLGFGVKEGTWLSISYTAGFAAFLLPAGIITDKIGSRLTLMTALLVFVLSSIYSTFCVSLESFTIIRLIQGISAAFLNTAAMALLNLLYPVGGKKDRAGAFKKWSMFLGLSFALGPILGSLIVSYVSWQWIMLINIPLGLFVLFPFVGNGPHRNQSGGALRKVSLLSTLPASTILLLITMHQYAARLSSEYGELTVNVIIVLCFLLLLLFHFTSDRSFTRLPELKSGAFLTSLLLPIIFSITYWSLFVVLPGYFKVRLNLSAMEVMLAMLLLSLPLTIVPVFKLQEKFRLNSMAGFLLISIGLILLSSIFFMNTEKHLLVTGLALVLLGVGAAILNPVMARVVMDNVAPENSGLAAALTSTLRQTGFAAGVAFFSLLTESKFSSGLHFSESGALLFTSILPLVALAICIGLNRRTQLLSKAH